MGSERAKSSEKTNDRERATCVEKTNGHERANDKEKTIIIERAINGEKTIHQKRPRPKNRGNIKNCLTFYIIYILLNNRKRRELCKPQK